MKKFLFLLLILSLFIEIKTIAQVQRTNLPTLYIRTNNSAPIRDKVNYVRGVITIVSSDITETVSGDSLGIRGRGNSTWGMSKKPFRIKLDSKWNLLNLPAKEKSWVLLANYADKTLMRNAVAFKISELVGLEFSPSMRFVDVVLNNDFLGNYLLTDQVQVGKKRVNIDEQTKEDVTEPAITGGYLLEIDGFATGEPVWFTTPKGLKITIKSPDEEEINQQQKNYIINYINNFENTLFASGFNNPETGYRPLVDTTSLVNWYIACELTGNSDSFWSTYIYKKRSDNKLYFGPLWDYDIAFNNDSRLGDATRKLMREYAHNPKTWIQRFWQDEWFQKAVQNRWNQLVEEGIENTLTNYISETAVWIDQSQQANFVRWPILSTKVYNETFLFKTYGEGVDYLKEYIRERVAFLTESFVVQEPAQPSEPFVADDNYYYMVINRKSNNVITRSPSNESVLELWDPLEDDNDQQLWKIVPLENDYYRFVNVLSGLAMTGNGRAVNLKQVAISENDDAQKWQILPVLTGNMYGIVNKKSGYSVNNSGGGIANGTAVIEYDNNMYLEEKVNQHWYIQKMEVASGSGETSVKKLPAASEIIHITNLSDGTIRIDGIPEKSTLEIINPQGQVFYSGKKISDELSIPLHHRGVYILKVFSGEKNYTMKFIR